LELMMPSKPVVHIVDDDAAIRRSLERLLASAGFTPVSYETPLAFLAAASGRLTGCILLDLWMPGMDGLEVQAHLCQMGVLLPVIVMTAGGDVQTAVRAMKAGAIDFIEKPFDDEVLLSAIEASLAPAWQGDRADEILDAARRLGALSPRERQVLDALLAGRPNKVIAYDLGLSVRTVEVHRARMMERLGVRQLSEAIRVAVMAALVSPISDGGQVG
jgi:two-component system, LuxR family, response regulator FixJ